MKVLEFNLCHYSTRIAVGLKALEELKNVKGEAVVIHSESINPKVVIEKLEAPVLTLKVKDGEEIKELSNVLSFLEEIASRAPPSFQWIVAIGGGTLLDVVGFIASIYRRGVKLANVPTTLLAMVDASLGGKNGVNFAGAKNIIGTFYHPRLVISDVMFLETLTDREISHGMAEVIKYCIVLDRELCDFLSNHHSSVFAKEPNVLEEMIYRSALNKMKIVSQDEREEKRIRIVLNFGHTIGHAIEAGSDFKIPHGQAVAIGMVCEAKLSEKLGVSRAEVLDRLIDFLKLYKLPISIDELDVSIDIEKAVSALKKDKKARGGFIDIPLPTSLGSWKRVELPLEALEVQLRSCLE
ncbi:MAG: 3-dehydroquinate synthase [Acidilobaceae archaeon]